MRLLAQLGVRHASLDLSFIKLINIDYYNYRNYNLLTNCNYKVHYVIFFNACARALSASTSRTLRQSSVIVASLNHTTGIHLANARSSAFYWCQLTVSCASDNINIVSLSSNDYNCYRCVKVTPVGGSV